MIYKEDHTVRNWESSVKCLLKSLGFNNAWLFQIVGNTNAFLVVVKQCLTGNFIQNWNERCILILTVPRRYFCCGSLLLLVLAVRIYGSAIMLVTYFSKF